MKLFFWCMTVAVLLSGCKFSRPSPRGALTAEQARYLTKYIYLRKLVTDTLGLPATATAEEIRPFAAQFLRCGSDASWDEMLETPVMRFWCTAKRLEKFRKIFVLPEGTTWLGLGLYVETLRLRVPGE